VEDLESSTFFYIFAQTKHITNMTREEISRRAKEKFIKAKKEFKQGDFFKVLNQAKTVIIGCFNSIDSNGYDVGISHYFAYSVSLDFVATNDSFEIDFDDRDLVKASPQDVMLLVSKLKAKGYYYDRKAKKIKFIEKLF
jgi:hypothetical protein